MVCRFLAPVIKQLLELIHDFAGFLQEDLQYFRVNGLLLGLFTGRSGFFGCHLVGGPEVFNKPGIRFRLVAFLQGVEHGLEADQGAITEA